MRRDYTRAESSFARGIRGVPGNALSWYEITWPQANQGQWARAESSLVVAEQRFPENSTRPIVEDYLLYRTRTARFPPALRGRRSSARAARPAPNGERTRAPISRSSKGDLKRALRSVRGSHRRERRDRDSGERRRRFGERHAHGDRHAGRIAPRHAAHGRVARQDAAQEHESRGPAVLQRGENVRATRSSRARAGHPGGIRARRSRHCIQAQATAGIARVARRDRAGGEQTGRRDR